MRVFASLFLAALLIPVPARVAAGPPPGVLQLPPPGGGSTLDEDCGTGGYFVDFLTDSLPVDVPDCGGPVRIGPNIVTLDDWISETVIVSAELHHSWIGDINLSVEHDADCDGVAETSVLLMCRAGSMDPGCSAAAPRGCSDDLEGTYSFFDWAGTMLGDPFATCVGGVVPPGCYRPVTPLSAFAGQSTRGCWWLVAEDCACGDAFRMERWGSGRIGGAMPVEPVTWGLVKYRWR